jgi:hypothetical protein
MFPRDLVLLLAAYSPYAAVRYAMMRRELWQQYRSDDGFWRAVITGLFLKGGHMLTPWPLICQLVAHTRAFAVSRTGAVAYLDGGHLMLPTQRIHVYPPCGDARLVYSPSGRRLAVLSPSARVVSIYEDEEFNYITTCEFCAFDADDNLYLDDGALPHHALVVTAAHAGHVAATRVYASADGLLLGHAYLDGRLEVRGAGVEFTIESHHPVHLYRRLNGNVEVTSWDVTREYTPEGLLVRDYGGVVNRCPADESLVAHSFAAVWHGKTLYRLVVQPYGTVLVKLTF